MRLRLYGRGRGEGVGALILLAIFAICGIVRYWGQVGDDLAASYVGCRLVASGNASHLYSHDPDNFAEIGDDDAWQKAADQGGFDGFLHPYVQTPLWAYGLEPICKRTDFMAFDRIFAVLAMLCFAGVIWLVARGWAPELMNPVAMGLILLCLWFSEPFRYAMFLMQTHVLFFVLTVASLILAERRKPVSAGLLLACAAAIKITPGFLVIYWLLTRRWKAAASAAACSVLFWIATVLVAGRGLVGAYLADLDRISRVLLVSENNQSFAAWCMARFYPPAEAVDMKMLPFPDALRLSSTALMIACIVIGGLLDRRRRDEGEGPRAPIGAMIALLGATIFAPIAWTHYFIILLAPLMVLLQENRRLRSWWIPAVVAVIVLLNFRPIAPNVEEFTVGQYAVVRSHFYSGALTMLALGAAAWQRAKRGRAATLAVSDGVATV